jgi:hypothetical protein
MLTSFSENLTPAEIETVRRGLAASVEGKFFPDWEFQTLMGVDRDVVRNVLNAWPNVTVGKDEFMCAVMNSLNNLLGYPHKQEIQLQQFVAEGRAAIGNVLRRLTELGL